MKLPSVYTGSKVLETDTVNLLLIVKTRVYLNAIIYRKSNVPPSSRYVPPPRVTPPNTIQDFDLENWSDPSQCSEYAQDIFQYYKNREVCI